ncbi:diaminopimelate decarboxylase [Canibacter zhoujuaniae]|uniref:diaminopimelate decarboxylase n=1 Tax=Canibacter zhoujuaniae TaxID=2708343 RepID=UPI001FB9882B|nr:diaminopimelate decarboxylase [Canibacter zhoujuaniae]
MSTDLNAINQAIFPSTAARNAEGELEIGGVAATALASDYGTPLFVFDEREFRARAKNTVTALRSEFQRIGADAKVYYSSKAFLCVEVARWAIEEGLHIDVASGGELAVVLAAGIDPKLIAMQGNNKSRAELREAIEIGIGSIVIDSAHEIERLSEEAAKLGKTVRVFLRVNSGVHATTHSFLATAHEDQKFGVPLTQAAELIERIRSDANMDLRGVHCHIGSQIHAVDGFVESAARMTELVAELSKTGPVPELNLGGGFGIAYNEAEVESAPNIFELAKQLADTVAVACERAGIPVPLLSFEPGRSIAAPAGVTLYAVGNIKTVDLTVSDKAADPADLGYTERRYISIDGGMSDNLRPAFYNATYTARLANRTSSAPPALSRVVGKHCETGDIVLHRALLQSDISEGDLLAFAATGAYGWVLASNYNYVPRPAVVAVRDGESRLIVRGETIKDLVARSVY